MIKRLLLIALALVVSLDASAPKSLIARRIAIENIIDRCGCTAHKPHQKPHKDEADTMIMERCGCNAHKPHAKPHKNIEPTQIRQYLPVVIDRCGCSAHKPQAKPHVKPHRTDEERCGCSAHKPHHKPSK